MPLARRDANRQAAKWARDNGFPVPGPEWDHKRRQLAGSANRAIAPDDHNTEATAKVPTPPERDAMDAVSTRKGYRPWTEEETLLLYWALPIMRSLSRMTGRGFPAIAMKMANLLAADTDNREGLANTSALDRAVVARYTSDKALLERRVVQILGRDAPTRSRATEIQQQAVDTLEKHGVALHVDLVGALLAARDPLLIAPTEVIRQALRSSTSIVELTADVFRFRGE